jgi:conjugative relaxase-like TrwC/TraI family protein
LVASFAVIKSSSYYTKGASSSAYYTNEEGTGVWLRGHDALGVTTGERVIPEDFDRICAGLDKSGKLLIQSARGPRMLGVDITLSAPKSFSVLYAVGDPALRQILAEAESSAVEATLQLIEKEIPLARRGHNGSQREHANFLAAVFTHSEARPERHADGQVFSDVQRHHHLCVPSLAEREDGTWGGIDGRLLRTWKKSLGSVFRLQLSSALQERGFAIEQADDGWSWSIGGVPSRLSISAPAVKILKRNWLMQA